MTKDVKLNPDQKTERFYPLLAKRSHFDEGNVFVITYYNREWELRELTVSAFDEINAFLVAKYILQQKRPYLMGVTADVLISTCIVLAIIGVVLVGVGIAHAAGLR